MIFKFTEIAWDEKLKKQFCHECMEVQSELAFSLDLHYTLDIRFIKWLKIPSELVTFRSLNLDLDLDLDLNKHTREILNNSSRNKTESESRFRESRYCCSIFVFSSFMFLFSSLLLRQKEQQNRSVTFPEKINLQKKKKKKYQEKKNNYRKHRNQ